MVCEFFDSLPSLPDRTSFIYTWSNSSKIQQDLQLYSVRFIPLTTQVYSQAKWVFQPVYSYAPNVVRGNSEFRKTRWVLSVSLCIPRRVINGEARQDWKMSRHWSGDWVDSESMTTVFDPEVMFFFFLVHFHVSLATFQASRSSVASIILSSEFSFR